MLTWLIVAMIGAMAGLFVVAAFSPYDNYLHLGGIYGSVVGFVLGLVLSIGVFPLLIQHVQTTDEVAAQVFQEEAGLVKLPDNAIVYRSDDQLWLIPIQGEVIFARDDSPQPHARVTTSKCESGWWDLFVSCAASRTTTVYFAQE